MANAKDGKKMNLVNSALNFFFQRWKKLDHLFWRR
jgi:hypothetical protein